MRRSQREDSPPRWRRILTAARQEGLQDAHEGTLVAALSGANPYEDAVSAALQALLDIGVTDRNATCIKLCIRDVHEGRPPGTRRPKKKTKPAPAADKPAAAPATTTPTTTADGLPIPREFLELCDSEEAVAVLIATVAARRLRHIAESGEWLYFSSTGWRPVLASTVEERLTDCARKNVGSVDPDTGAIKLRPFSAGRKAVGRSIAGLLSGREEVSTRAAEWDAVPNLIVMPDGDLLDVLTSERRRPTANDLHRRRVRVEPATEAAFAESRFRFVVENVLPDPDERAFVQRRLGAALADAEGMDDLLWLYGEPAAGKRNTDPGVGRDTRQLRQRCPGQRAFARSEQSA